MIKLSIITLTKNNFSELERTYNSIINQTNKKNIELIIVNGGRKISKKFYSRYFKIKIIKDNSKGIYDAMNLGCKFANGNHVLFLNSGDILNNKNVLNNLNNYSLSKNYSYFFVCKVIGEVKTWHIPTNIKKILPGDSVPVHQSILYNKKFYNKYSYNTQFKIAADYEHKLILLRNYKNRVKFIPFVVSNHMLGGISSKYTLLNYIIISKELFIIDYNNQSLLVLIRNQINLFVKFILFQLKLSKLTEKILSKIYENKAYEIKI